MRHVLERADDHLIDRVFQPLVNRIAETLSLDCFQLARVCTSISAIAWIMSQAPDLTAAARSGWVALQIFQTTIFLLGLGAIMVLHTLFQRVGGGGRGSANPLRPAMFIQRLIILAGLAGSVVKAACGVGSPALFAVTLSASAALYVGACSNPPPRLLGRPRTNSGASPAAVQMLLRVRSSEVALTSGVNRPSQTESAIV